MNNSIKWTEQHEPVGLSLDQLLYRIRQSDSADGLIFDSASMDDILSEEGVELLAFDALVFTYSLLRRKMDILLRTMNRAGGNLEVSALQVSDPFRRNGVAQVAAVFELSDGQTVSVYFHNPDSTPGKLTPKDEMISWKWLLNKKDITIVVAPERGNDIAIREVARRIMKLADRNSAAFAKNNVKRAERLENISSMKEEIANLEVELEGINKQIEIRRVEIESEQLKPKMSASDGLSALESIKSFISRGQYRTISKAMRGEEKQFFIDKARLLADIINGMAEIYDQDGKGMDATAYLHYFNGSSNWYITEKDNQGGTRQAFGYASLGQGQGGELGYVSIDELTKNEVELDLYFDPAALSSIIGKEEDTAEGEEGSDDDKLMSDARTMVATVSSEFGGTLSEWELSSSESAHWDYAVLTVSDLTLRVGVSAGGVISVDGKPHDPEGRIIDSQDSLRAAISALLPVEDLSWELDKDSVTAMDEDQFQREVAELEEDNLRSQAALLLAKRKGTDEQIAEAQSILDEHDQLGHAPPELIQRRETLREALEQVKPDAPMGVTQDPAITMGDDVIVPEGAESKVKTAKGTEIATGFTVLEADQVIASHDSSGNANPDYPQELQPRDRGRTSSVAWVRKVANQLDPDSLGKTRRADSGAPIVGPDGVVESGNGRTMAIQEAYRSGKADEYREWLEDEAELFGLDISKVKAMRAPVLVRVRTSSIDRRQFAIEANQDDKLAMTGTERAKADADRLDSALMATLSDDGNLLSAANRGFVTGFLQSLGESESAQYVTTAGQPTGALIGRIQAAVFAKAYDDERLLELSADVSKPEVANVIEALNVAAPEFILARNADADSAQAAANQIVDSVEASMNEQAIEAIIQATNLVRQSRADGTSVEDAVNQMGLFGDISPATAAMALFINKNNRSAKRLGVAFKAMAEFVKQEAERGQTVDMFGDATPVELSDIIAAANRKLDEEYGEGAFAINTLDMFSPQPEVELTTVDVQDDLDEARAQTETDPTEKQKESGEYAKGELSAFGLDIVVENPKGSVRSKKNKTSGDEWSVSMAHDYGYIKGTKGADGDEVDVFIGPNLDSETAYVIEQVDADGKLDEHKVMLGFNDEAGASQGYLSSYKPGWDGLGSIKEMSLDELKAWLPSAASANNEPQQSEQSTPEHELNQDPTPTDVPDQEVEPATVEPEPAAQAGESQVDQLNALKKLAPKTGEAVRSDDPDAIAKLEAKLNYLQSLAQMMRDANKHVRKGDIESLAAMGFNDKTIQALSAPDNSGRKGFAQYQMANNSSEVGRTKRRLKQLYREQEAESMAIASEPVEPTIEAEPAAEPIIDAAPEEVTVANDDAAFLESVANGAVADMLSPELGEQITAALERNIENESMAELLERAVMAYQSAAELATSDI